MKEYVSISTLIKVYNAMILSHFDYCSLVWDECADHLLKPGSHISPMVGDSLSVVIHEENSQRILCMSNYRQWASPTSATYENQA